MKSERLVKNALEYLKHKEKCGQNESALELTLFKKDFEASAKLASKIDYHAGLMRTYLNLVNDEFRDVIPNTIAIIGKFKIEFVVEDGKIIDIHLRGKSDEE